MNFELDEQRQMLADTFGRYIADQYSLEARTAKIGSIPPYSRDNWARLAELGIIGALFDENVGGFGGTGVDIMIVFEAIGRGLVVEPFLETLLSGHALAASGGRDDVLAEIVAGRSIVAFAHQEPEGHYELAHVASRAERKGDGWVLNGAKAVVGYAGIADLLLVSARTGGAVDDEDGLSLFLVPAGANGVNVRPYTTMDGDPAGEVTFDNVSLGADAIVGTEGAGFAVVEAAVGAGLLALSAESLGAMEAAKDATLEYLRTRTQFGTVIGSFQALQHRMANVLIEIEQVRSAVINAADALGGDRIVRERALSAAKYTIGRTGTLVAEEAIQMHGGIGMTWELPLSHYAKRLVMIDHKWGDEDHHLERYIALGQAGSR